MKKFLSFLVIMLSLAMQSITALAGGINTPVLLQLRVIPWQDGIHRPTKSDPNLEPPVNVYLSEASDSLLFYSTSEESVTYYIYDADEQEVSNGSIFLSEQGEASIYTGFLEEGVYTIYLVIDEFVYGGDFQM